MRIGFVGAHRTGKSTLASAIAAANDLTPIYSSVSEIVKRNGFDMKDGNRITPGLPLQTLVLRDMMTRLVGDNYVADRTPIDAAAYLLADATAGVGDAALHEEVLRYMDTAIRETFKRFDLIVLVPPAISVEPHPDKPPVNPAYQMHHHLLCRAMTLDVDYPTVTAELPVEVLSLSERVTFVEAHFAMAINTRRRAA